MFLSLGFQFFFKIFIYLFGYVKSYLWHIGPTRCVMWDLVP